MLAGNERAEADRYLELAVRCEQLLQDVKQGAAAFREALDLRGEPGAGERCACDAAYYISAARAWTILKLHRDLRALTESGMYSISSCSAEARTAQQRPVDLIAARVMEEDIPNKDAKRRFQKMRAEGLDEAEQRRICEAYARLTRFERVNALFAFNHRFYAYKRLDRAYRTKVDAAAECAPEDLLRVLGDPDLEDLFRKPAAAKQCFDVYDHQISYPERIARARDRGALCRDTQIQIPLALTEKYRRCPELILLTAILYRAWIRDDPTGENRFYPVPGGIMALGVFAYPDRKPENFFSQAIDGPYRRSLPLDVLRNLNGVTLLRLHPEIVEMYKTIQTTEKAEIPDVKQFLPMCANAAEEQQDKPAPGYDLAQPEERKRLMQDELDAMKRQCAAAVEPAQSPVWVGKNRLILTDDGGMGAYRGLCSYLSASSEKLREQKPPEMDEALFNLFRKGEYAEPAKELLRTHIALYLANPANLAKKTNSDRLLPMTNRSAHGVFRQFCAFLFVNYEKLPKCDGAERKEDGSLILRLLHLPALGAFDAGIEFLATEDGRRSLSEFPDLLHSDDYRLSVVKKTDGDILSLTINFKPNTTPSHPARV